MNQQNNPHPSTTQNKTHSHSFYNSYGNVASRYDAGDLTHADQFYNNQNLRAKLPTQVGQTFVGFKQFPPMWNTEDYSKKNNTGYQGLNSSAPKLKDVKEKQTNRMNFVP